jgi:quercetin dioxygenase-like cupin family protein
VVTRARESDDRWIEGRAGMRYLDVVPGRQGGRLIASRIQIEHAGPVPDYVHFHRVRFQMIFCTRGWVRVVYEDQGPPFVLSAGDCVLQAPEIRHRVLESSANLEVLEIGSPAHHETFADHDLALPTSATRPERLFGGQRFVHHRAASAVWRPSQRGGFEARDTGIADATSGLADVRVLRSDRAEARDVIEPCAHDGELVFGFVLAGGVTLRAHGSEDATLVESDSFVVPRAMRHALVDATPDLELLQLLMR